VAQAAMTRGWAEVKRPLAVVAVTVVMFTEGRTFVPLKFDAAAIAVPPPLAAQVAQRQDALIKTTSL
jgi:hypothetical protein